MPLAEAPLAGVLLAAGASRRLGSPKALLKTEDGRPLVAVMAERLLQGGCARLCVVLGAEAPYVEEALRPLVVVEGDRVATVVHERWSDGMGSSLAAGVRHVLTSDWGAEAMMLATCDMPTVTARHVEALVSAWRPSPAARVASGWITPEGRAVHGVPAVLPRADGPALAALSGDEGARGLLRQPGTVVVPLASGHLDLDTPEDVARWRATWGNRDL